MAGNPLNTLLEVGIWVGGIYIFVEYILPKIDLQNLGKLIPPMPQIGGAQAQPEDLISELEGITSDGGEEGAVATATEEEEPKEEKKSKKKKKK